MRTTQSTSTTLRATALMALLLGALGSIQAQERRTDNQWPVVFTSGSDQMQVFAPQPERVEGDRFTARFAVALQRPQDANPIFGAVWGNGVLELDRSSRMGQLISFTVTDARFPGVTDVAEQQRIKEMLSEGLPKHTAPIAIDWLVAALENEQQGVATYANDPPEIIYREKPGVLVFIDGDPQFMPIEADEKRNDDPNYLPSKMKVDRVVNTPFLLVRPSSGALYLYGSSMWFTAQDLKGPWTRSFAVPADLRSIAQRIDSTASLDAKSADGSSVVPEIVVRTNPAVLLDLDGPPKFAPLPGTALLYATNTDDDLFLDVASQDHYLLASGRWFATRDPKTGPWRYVPSDQLPAEFAKIPEGSAKDGTLAHIAGTRAAKEAVRDASIPQTARVDRKSARLVVQYDGDPEFELIPGTQVENAINASVTVLRINGYYHALDNAVWFDGPTPDGPWSVSTSVPGEVNSIPPSSPAYNTRYVYIYDSTPDVVYVGYTPGYFGSYVQGGSLIYGTGYYYNPWRGRWRPRPFTYGFGVYYNPWSGWGWGLGWGWNWYYPSWYGWGWGGYYRPYGYGCGYGWWGPYGYYPNTVSDHHHYYGHRTSVGAVGGRSQADGRRDAPNLYADRERQGVRPASVTRTAAVINDRATGRPNDRATTPAGDRTMRPSANDHFTDRDGNVYRQDNGRTERYDAGRWTPMADERPTSVPTRNTDRPVIRTEPTGRPTETTQPTRTERSEPRIIQQSRDRGNQRVIDFNRSRQQPTTRPSQPSRTAPSRPSAPPRSTAPSRGGSSSPSRSAPSPSRTSSPSPRR